MILKRILYILFLATIIIPFNLFDNRLYAGLNVVAVIGIVFLTNRYLTTKMLQKRSFSQLRESKRELKKGGFVYDATVSFGNLMQYSMRRFNAREFANFQIKEKGILVRTWESISFGILYENITKIEIIELNDDTTTSGRFNCYVRIHVTYDEPEIYFFRIAIDEDFVKWLLPFYKGKLIHLTYKEFWQEMQLEKGKQAVS